MYPLTDAILSENISTVRELLRMRVDLNQMDVYGYTPLIEAAIVDNIEISKVLLENGADPNLPDVTGATALHWAIENSNANLCQLLLSHRADPNAYNLAGQPAMVMAMLRQNKPLTTLLVKAGADQVFAHDYINTKLLGHLYELVGTVSIIDPKNNFVEVDFEGFFIEVTVGLIAESLAQFQNHFAARRFRRYAGISTFIVEVMNRAQALIKYQQYRVDRSRIMDKIDEIVKHDPLIIPVGYEGHAITFIRFEDLWVKCDRREDSRLYDNVMIYHIRNKQNLTNDLIKSLIYQKHDSQFINEELDSILGLEPITEIKVEAQISGNCSWANVEAAIPALFFLVMMKLNYNESEVGYYKTLALNYFHRFREWNKERSLQFCINRFNESDVIRKASHAEILAAILFQRCDTENIQDRARVETIIQLLANSPYRYLLVNYVRVYYYEGNTDEGRRFFELLKEHGVIKE